MKFHQTIILLLLTEISRTNAFVHQAPLKGKTITTLNAKKGGEDGGIWAAAATTFIGLTFASQMAFAAPNMDLQNNAMMSSSNTISAVVETLDFSLPSYGEEVKTSTSDKPNLINPFGDTDDASSAKDTKAFEAKQAADKKAEEKAAADAKQKAIEDKKAEKAARLKAEKEKQRLLQEREKQRREEDAAKAEQAAANVFVPEVKSFEPAKKEVFEPVKTTFEPVKREVFEPVVKKAPEERKAPEFKKPELPDFKAPDFKAPEFKAPDFKAPEFKAPSFSMPKVPELSIPETPKAPKAAAPSYTAPSYSSPKSDYDFGSLPSAAPSPKPVKESKPAKEYSPQETRDSDARNARSNYVNADKDAKVLEAKARALRDIANDKKKLSNEAKDLACETRPGGKILCVRPFGSGY